MEIVESLGMLTGLQPRFVLTGTLANFKVAVVQVSVTEAVAVSPQVSPATMVKMRVQEQPLFVSVCVTLLVTELQVSV